MSFHLILVEDMKSKTQDEELISNWAIEARVLESSFPPYPNCYSTKGLVALRRPDCISRQYVIEWGMHVNWG